MTIFPYNATVQRPRARARARDRLFTKNPRNRALVFIQIHRVRLDIMPDEMLI